MTYIVVSVASCVVLSVGTARTLPAARRTAARMAKATHAATLVVSTVAADTYQDGVDAVRPGIRLPSVGENYGSWLRFGTKGGNK